MIGDTNEGDTKTRQWQYYCVRRTAFPSLFTSFVRIHYLLLQVAKSLME
jgi:hypothetical protein